MRIDGRRRARGSRGAALRTAAFVALVGMCSASPVGRAEASAPRGALSQSDDPCRFITAEAMGKAIGRAMKSSKLANVCEYRGPGTELVVVKVAVGTEGTILRRAKAAVAQGDKAVEKVATAVGEAYFDTSFPLFIGRVRDHEVQIETTIQPVPREALISVGGRIMDSLADK